MKIAKDFQSRFQLVKVAARRARQLQGGAKPMVASSSMKACRVAQDEIRAGHVEFMVPEPIVEASPFAVQHTAHEREHEREIDGRAEPQIESYS